MNKTKLKIFLTLGIAAIAIVCQEYLRRYWNANPQIWIFVVYVMSMIGCYLIIYVFCEELGKTQKLETINQKLNNSIFTKLLNEDCSVKEERKVKEIVKKLLRSKFWDNVSFFMTMFLIVSLLYMPFFLDTFINSKIMGIIVMYLAIDYFIRVIAYENFIRRVLFVFLGSVMIICFCQIFF